SLRSALLVLPAARLLSLLLLELLGAERAHPLPIPLHLLRSEISILSGMGLSSLGVSGQRLLPARLVRRLVIAAKNKNVAFTPYSCAAQLSVGDGYRCLSAFCEDEPMIVRRSR